MMLLAKVYSCLEYVSVQVQARGCKDILLQYGFDTFQNSKQVHGEKNSKLINIFTQHNYASSFTAWKTKLINLPFYLNSIYSKKFSRNKQVHQNNYLVLQILGMLIE